MTRLLIVELEVEAEISKSADWYEQRNPMACVAFLRAVDRTLRLIQEQPEQYQVVYRQTRRAQLDGFPYAIFYNLTEREILVVSCFHTSRNPKEWRDRLP